MKITWETSDIKVGLRVGKKDFKERWMIGYIASGDSKDNRVLISLSDGMVCHCMINEKLAKSLTDGKYLPEIML